MNEKNVPACQNFFVLLSNNQLRASNIPMNLCIEKSSNAEISPSNGINPMNI